MKKSEYMIQKEIETLLTFSFFEYLMNLYKVFVWMGLELGYLSGSWKSLEVIELEKMILNLSSSYCDGRTVHCRV